MVNFPAEKNRLNTTSAGSAAAETDLKSSLQQQSSVFENAVRVIERLEQAANRRELGNPDSVTQLQKALSEVVAAQQKVSAAHTRYADFKIPAGSELRQNLERHESLLKTLISRINLLQGVFEEICTELTPQLDTESRRRNMQSAYQQSMRNS